ncbi:MAG: transporter substrate-binding domain-containing protein [Ottowia sp.]|uniref:transporter substrate-binding domain-containing protein n=1 Tax=Ottowia sp. TaxID=1898956 RepID=UPI0039E4AC80
MTSLSKPAALAAARAALLVNGKLRVGLNLSNTLLVRQADPADHVQGVAPALAGRLASALDVQLEFVRYDTPVQVMADAANGVWSIAFLAVDPLRAGNAVFSHPYAGIEATYIVPADSLFTDAAQVDAPGIRIALFKGSAYDLWLQQHLRHAQLVHADTPEQAVEWFRRDRLDALAGLRVQLDSQAAREPRERVLESAFTAVHQAVALPKDRAAALPYLDAFLQREKQSGVLAALIVRLAPPGLQILHGTTAGRP